MLEDLASQTIAESRQALVFLPDEVGKLERAQECLGMTPDALMALHIRCLIAFSGRFSDGQHIRPDSLQKVDGGATASIWKSKVSGPTKSRIMMPVFIPSDAILNSDWLDQYLALQEMLGGFTWRDYLLPGPGSVRMSVRSAPCSSSETLRWMRYVLQKLGISDTRSQQLTFFKKCSCYG